MNCTLTRFSLFAVLLSALTLFSVGCASSEQAAAPTVAEEEQAAAPTVAEEIPEGANRIVMDRQEMTEELTVDTPGLAFYVDARQHLEENGYEIETADEEELFLTTAPKQLEDGLALRLNINIDPAPGGSRLIALAEYAPSVTAGANAWQEASWTGGQAQEAFSAAVDMMQNLSYSEFGTATE